MKIIAICADDYGQNPTISAGILDLIAKKRISAVSCLTNSPYWLTEAEKLKNYRHVIDLGLHFNLTEGLTLNSHQKLPSISTLIFKAYTKQLKQIEIEAELRAQIQAFVQGLGKLPDYIDGHQHIHQLPIIRDALIKVYQEFYPNNQAYIRVLNFKPKGIKETILFLLGSQALQQRLDQINIPHNSTFSGIYSFACKTAYESLFKRFLQRSKSQGIIMCHPGFISDEYPDPIAAIRIKEYNYLNSDDFLKLCAAENIKIGLLSKHEHADHAVQ